MFQIDLKLKVGLTSNPSLSIILRQRPKNLTQGKLREGQESQGRNAKIKDKNANWQVKIQKAIQRAGSEEQEIIFTFLFVILTFDFQVLSYQ